MLSTALSHNIKHHETEQNTTENTSSLLVDVEMYFEGTALLEKLRAVWVGRMQIFLARSCCEILKDFL